MSTIRAGVHSADGFVGKAPEEVARQIIADLRNEGVWRGEVESVRKDGSRFWCKRAEAELQQSVQRLNLVLEATGRGAWDWNIQTGDVHFSRFWISSLGYTSQEVAPRVTSWESMAHPDDMPGVRHALEGRPPANPFEWSAPIRIFRNNAGPDCGNSLPSVLVARAFATRMEPGKRWNCTLGSGAWPSSVRALPGMRPQILARSRRISVPESSCRLTAEPVAEIVQCAEPTPLASLASLSPRAVSSSVPLSRFALATKCESSRLRCSFGAQGPRSRIHIGALNACGQGSDEPANIRTTRLRIQV